MKLPYGILATVLFSASAHATVMGGNSGGGGRGVVCRTKTGAVKSVELLDLWEARELYKRTIVKSSKPVDVQVSAAIEALANISSAVDTDFSQIHHVEEPMNVVTREQLQTTADLFLKNDPKVQRLHKITLLPTDDSFEAARPSDCAVEQLVNFDDTALGARVLVNQDLVDHMDRTNQAALIVHESLYHRFRGYDDEANSVRVRRAVGYVFAGQSFPNIGSMLGDKYVICETAVIAQEVSPGWTTVYFYMLQDGEVGAINERLFGQWMMGFFPDETHPAFKSFDDLLAFSTEQDCSVKDGLSVGNTIQSNGGPADFEIRDLIADGCDHGKTGVWISPRGIAQVLPPEAERLTCKLVDKTK